MFSQQPLGSILPRACSWAMPAPDTAGPNSVSTQRRQGTHGNGRAKDEWAGTSLPLLFNSCHHLLKEMKNKQCTAFNSSASRRSKTNFNYGIRRQGAPRQPKGVQWLPQLCPGNPLPLRSPDMSFTTFVVPSCPRRVFGNGENLLSLEVVDWAKREGRGNGGMDGGDRNI